MPPKDAQPSAARDLPAKRERAAFGSPRARAAAGEPTGSGGGGQPSGMVRTDGRSPDREAFWKTVAQWSALLFFTAAGLAALGYVYWSGPGSLGPRAWLASRQRGGPSVAGQALESDAVPVHDPTVARRAVDGQPLEDGVQDGPYLAVMIDNHSEARPLSGLSAAPLVYEAPVEGGITRVMAIYPASQLVKRIGPVRSARPYFLDWAAEFDALYAHVGGSPAALEMLKDPSRRDLNEFWNGKYFWRDLSRPAPHNAYTSTGLLGQAWAARYGDEDQPHTVGARQFQQEAPLADRPTKVPDITVDFSSRHYQATWRYDRQNNDYRRLESGNEQSDEDWSPVRAKNVIVEYHKMQVIDSVGRREIETVGQGRAVILNDGQVTEAVWSKSDAADRTRYLTPEGDEVSFNVGTTWVEIVPPGLELGGLDQPEQ